MLSSIAKWGNSAALRIPASVLSQANLKAGDCFDLVVNPDQTITLKPIRKHKPKLADLLAAITPENLPDIADDAPQGTEIW
jgi:antitoxin MazE